MIKPKVYLWALLFTFFSSTVYSQSYQYALVSNKEGVHHSGAVILLDSNLSSDSLIYSFQNFGKEATWLDMTHEYQNLFAIGEGVNFLMEYHQGLDNPPICYNYSPYNITDIISEDSNFIFLYEENKIIRFDKSTHQFQEIHQLTSLPTNSDIFDLIKKDQGGFYALIKIQNMYAVYDINNNIIDTLPPGIGAARCFAHRSGDDFLIIRNNQIYTYNAITYSYTDSVPNPGILYGVYDKTRDQYHYLQNLVNYSYVDLFSYSFSLDSVILRRNITIFNFLEGWGTLKLHKNHLALVADLIEPISMDSYEGLFYYNLQSGFAIEQRRIYSSSSTNLPREYGVVFPTYKYVTNFSPNGEKITNYKAPKTTRKFYTQNDTSAQTIDALMHNGQLYIQANNGSHQTVSSLYKFEMNGTPPTIYPLGETALNMFQHNHKIHITSGEMNDISFDELNANNPISTIDGKRMISSGTKVDNFYVSLTKDANRITYLSKINLVTLEETSEPLPFGSRTNAVQTDIVLNQSKTAYYIPLIQNLNNVFLPKIFKLNLKDNSWTTIDLDTADFAMITSIKAGINDDIYFSANGNSISNFGAIGRINSEDDVSVLHQFDSVTWSTKFEFPKLLLPTEDGMIGSTKDYVFEVDTNGFQIINSLKEATNLVLLDSAPVITIDTTLCINSFFNGMYLTHEGSYEFDINGAMGQNEKHIYNISLEQYTPEILQTKLIDGGYLFYPSLATTDIVWYESCNFNTPFSTQDTITVQNGAYNYIASVGDMGCVDTSDCIYTVVLGLNESADKLFSLYPNPASQDLNISVLKNSKFEMVDMQGKVVRTVELKAGDNRLDISGLIPGIYFIKNITDRKTLPFKLVITN